MEIESLVIWGLTQANHTRDMERKGHHKIVWPLLTQIRKQLELDTLVGPSASEAAPDFPAWVPGFDEEMISDEACQLLVLEAIPEDLRFRAVAAALSRDQWAVIAPDTPTNWTDKDLGNEIYTMLSQAGRVQEMLDQKHVKVYGKGWSSTGDKRMHLGGKL